MGGEGTLRRREIPEKVLWAGGMQRTSPTLSTPPNRHLLPRHPLRAPLGQVLSLWNQTLMNRTGQQGDAVPAHLIAEVLAGDADA